MRRERAPLNPRANEAIEVVGVNPNVTGDHGEIATAFRTMRPLKEEPVGVFLHRSGNVRGIDV